MDLSTLTEAELGQLKIEIEQEISDRSYVANAPAIVAEVQQRVLALTGREMEAPFVQPTGAHDAYPLGWTVTDQGKTWESLVAGNSHKPGESGWREKVLPGRVPVWVQPSGAHDAYSFGDRVMHKRKKYINQHPGARTNTWEPGVFSGWVLEP